MSPHDFSQLTIRAKSKALELMKEFNFKDDDLRNLNALSKKQLQVKGRAQEPAEPKKSRRAKARAKAAEEKRKARAQAATQDPGPVILSVPIPAKEQAETSKGAGRGKGQAKFATLTKKKFKGSPNNSSQDCTILRNVSVIFRNRLDLN